MPCIALYYAGLDDHSNAVNLCMNSDYNKAI